MVKFGIGISKSYARRNSFSPVVYVHEKSDTMLRYLRSIKKADFMNNPDSLLPYFKMDETFKIGKDGRKLATRLYDEREWRWIPKNPDYEDLVGMAEEEIRDSTLEYINTQLDKDKSKYKIPFEFTDITYIFVQQEDDVDKVIEELRKSRIDQKSADRLIAKIVTSRQIEKDF